VDFLSKQIEKALDAQFYYLAVVCALTLPDICSALESEDGTSTSTKYMAWCDTWFLDSYPNLTSTDLWSLRCGVVHEGKLGHPKMQYSRVIFTFPIPSGNVFHNNILNGALNLDARIFCQDMINSVSCWYSQKKDDIYVKANLPRMIRLYPDGLPPYIVGVPVIS
jgi:hypothetical protein